MQRGYDATHGSSGTGIATVGVTPPLPVGESLTENRPIRLAASGAAADTSHADTSHARTDSVQDGYYLRMRTEEEHAPTAHTKRSVAVDPEAGG
jgi:hypothetical protein